MLLVSNEVSLTEETLVNLWSFTKFTNVSPAKVSLYTVDLSLAKITQQVSINQSQAHVILRTSNIRETHPLGNNEPGMV